MSFIVASTNLTISDENSSSQDFDYHYKVAKYLSFSMALMSFLSVIFIIVMYKICKGLHNIAYKMIIYLQIADGIIAFSLLLQIFDPIDHPILCQIQSFIGNYGCVSSYFWTCCITTAIYRSTTGKWRRVEPYERYFLVISYGFPLIISIIPFIVDGYGNSSYWCWIQVDNINPVKRDVLIIMVLFIYLWFAMIYNSVLILLVYKFFRKYNKRIPLKKYDKHLKTIISYPIAMVICWLFPSLYRIFQMAGYEAFWASILHVICEGINGFVNTVIYAANKKFKTEVRNSLLSESLLQDQFITNL